MNLNKDIKIIEAILFASNEPVLEEDLIEKINEKNKLNEYLKILEEFYSPRGINLSKTGSKLFNNIAFAEDTNVKLFTKIFFFFLKLKAAIAR